jgi:hypothetical protein
MKRLEHSYTTDDLRSIWLFSRQNFDTFIELLEWLETLSVSEFDKQVSSAHYIESHKR